MDEENINKDTLKFDIEFMCRCLGLALMRIIEQGKEKQHITELYTSNEKDNQVLNFKFYNSEFNKSINLLKDFFNTNNNEKLGEMNMISILEKFCLEHGDVDNDDIDMMKHIIKNGDEKIVQKDDIQEETFKLRNGLADIENEIKFIGEFFSYGKKKKNYQNLSENTKKILCKDLSYIKEIKIPLIPYEIEYEIEDYNYTILLTVKENNFVYNVKLKQCYKYFKDLGEKDIDQNIIPIYFSFKK